MGAMSSPQVAASLVVLAAGSLTVHLARSPAPFAGSSAAVIAIGAMLFAVLASVGLMVVRGRWARWLALSVAVGVIGVAAIAEDFGGWAFASVGLGLGALVTLAGRWLDGWIRGRPSATGPDPKAVVLLIGFLALVPLVGLASPGGLETAHGMLGAGGVLLAWGYSKALVWALWAARLVLPLLVIAAALASPLPGALALLGVGAVLAWLTWTPEARLAVQPLLESTPGPRRIPGERRRSSQ